MRAPEFWWRKAGAAAAALGPVAALYGAVAAHRLRQPGARVGVPVVCIGDPTLGGAGKTPTAIATARLLAAAGERPVFLTRGYGGREAGPLVVNGRVHRAKDVGDEPLLLARAQATIVARDRLAGAHLARASGASVIVMDDGFQNPSLAKDCAILVVDARRGVGNGRVFPSGPLRAPLEAQLDRAHAVMAIGSGAAAAPLLEAAARRGLRIFRARLEPAEAALAAMRARPALAFAGIGSPEKFFATLAAAGVAVRIRHSFADHHAYTAADAARLLREADTHGLALVTTEKDLVRLDGEGSLRELRSRAFALPVQLALENEKDFLAFLRERIRTCA